MAAPGVAGLDAAAPCFSMACMYDSIEGGGALISWFACLVAEFHFEHAWTSIHFTSFLARSCFLALAFQRDRMDSAAIVSRVRSASPTPNKEPCRNAVFMSSVSARTAACSLACDEKTVGFIPHSCLLGLEPWPIFLAFDEWGFKSLGQFAVSAQNTPFLKTHEEDP